MNKKMTVLHIEGAWDIPVRVCMFAALGILAGIFAVSVVSNLRMATKYRKKYERKYKEKQLRAQIRNGRGHLRAADSNANV